MQTKKSSKEQKEIDLYREGGVDAVIVENYYGNFYQMEKVPRILTNK